MKNFYLFLFLFLCGACSNLGNKDALDTELSKVPILSSSFDSLLSEVEYLPIRDRIECIIKISHKNEEEIDGVKKQERLLMKVLPFTSGRKRKEVLIQLVRTCSSLDRFGVSGAYSKGLKWIEMLETNHSLSQEEEWQVNEMKALLLNRSGYQEDFLPVWYRLLKQYREADKPEDVGKCLLTIASHFVMLEDYENALLLYKEAYQLALEHKFMELQQTSGIMLIKYLCGAGYYSESLDYYKRINPEIAFNPSIQNEVVKSYMELNKPDSARMYLVERLLVEKGNKFVLNCMMAETYIPEEQDDSAFLFLDRAMTSYKEKTKNYQRKSKEATLLPHCFLSPCYLFADLLWKKGKIQQANQYYTIVEPLMKEIVKTSMQMELQIKALTNFSSFCRETKQYEKALDLLSRRDSVLQTYLEFKAKNDKKNYAERLKIQELKHELNESEDVNRINTHVAAICIFLLVISVAATFKSISMYRKLKKQGAVNYRLQGMIKKCDEGDMPKSHSVSMDQYELLFWQALHKVRDEQYFLKSDLTIETLADVLNTNRSYLSVSINRFCDKGFSVWLNNFRIQHAEQLMRENPSIALKDLPEQCGYATTGTFVRNFKRCHNMSPSEFMNKLLIEQTLPKVEKTFQ
ncbi:AraC family transcriptional regulator [Bacteroides intestinalis]|uniref:AraC family transcriptional regulator n=1 Tax=Bacteroides intestinalis TaxID=329854 RepID=A0A412YFX5_9BACE|nr:helix-turn-helix domain-containing protein [Bacteroides intestinalis]RGV56253.1 AraC family transcriptional regulator [Bacteroides intestinalis]RHA61824.1 AraC family transcriptional regulator [Bacteroides intestinalis]